MRRRGFLLGRLGAVTLLALVAAVSAARAQTRVAVLEEPYGTAVGVSVVVNAGSAWEADAEAGVTYLAGLAVLHELHPQLEALGAEAEVVCDPSSLRFTLLTPPATWRVATDLFLDALFRGAVDDNAVAKARSRLLRSLALEAGNPTGDLQHLLHQALFGQDHRWARRSCGTAATVARLGPDDVGRILRARFAPQRTAVAVAGPVAAESARRFLSERLGDVEPPVLLPAPELAAAPGFKVLRRETVTSWLGLAFPVARPADSEALRLLAFRLRERLSPAPTRVEIYNVTTGLRRHGRRNALVVHLIVSAGEARGWAERVQTLIEELAARPLSDEAFDALRSRYRGWRLRTLATPEARARDAALHLFYEHDHVPPAERIAQLTPARLRDAAVSLADPAVAIIGPAKEQTP